MIWQTWRQHRAEALGLAVVLLALVAVALVQGIPMHLAFVQDGVAGCLQSLTDSARCERAIETFDDRFSAVPMQMSGLLNFLPLVVGILIGAPMLAREYEQGTWQLAWTQAVPRMRWAVVKFGLVLATTVLVSLLLSALLGWWLQPFGRTSTSVQSFSVERFNYASPALSGYFVLAVATGLLAGAVIRRLIPAIAATLMVFLTIRMLAEYAGRPAYRPPVTAIDPVAGDRRLTHGIVDGDNWILDTFIVDRSGARLSDAQEFDVFEGREVDAMTLTELGLREGVTYHPGTRFWEFQFIEAGMFWALAALFVVLAIWRLRRW